MIVLDSDVLLIELRYVNDPRHLSNHRFLQQTWTDGSPLAVTVQVLLEVVGNLSFNTSPTNIPQLPHQIMNQLKLAVFPDWQLMPDYAMCTVPELIDQMRSQMSLGDAVQALQIARFVSHADCLCTWNAKHFVGKLVVPVLTPDEWLQQRLQGSP